jgi:hypothetical protein
MPNSSSGSFAVASPTDERLFPIPAANSTAGPSSGVPPLDPRDVARSVKLMSKRGKVHPRDMKIMFGEEGNYDSEAEVATERRSQDSLQNSIDSRNSGESVEQLEERLRQLESIIRSKDRIDAEQIRDSLKDEVLIGQGGGRVGKAY